MSFFLGFATGAAKAVDKSLQDSIERTRDNIDMISKFRLKTAAERQEKKRKKSQEIDELIKYGASILDPVKGSANPLAINMASDLIKAKTPEGFRNYLDQISGIVKDSDISPIDFATRAQEDAPLYSSSELSDAYVDSAYSFGKVDVPTGIIKGGGLLSKIVGRPIDVVEESVRDTKQQMDELITTPTAIQEGMFIGTTIDLEGMRVRKMTPNDRLAYYDTKLLDNTVSDERKNKFRIERDGLLKAAEQSGEFDIVVNSLTAQLNGARQNFGEDSNQYKTILSKLQSANKQRDKSIATIANDRVALAEIDYQDATNALLDNDNEDNRTALRIAERNLLKAKQGEITDKDEIAFLNSDIERIRRENPDTFQDMQIYKDKVAALTKLQDQQKELERQLKGVDSTEVTTIYNNMQSIFEDRLEEMSDLVVLNAVGKFSGIKEGLNVTQKSQIDDLKNLIVRQIRDASDLDPRAIDLAAQRFLGTIMDTDTGIVTTASGEETMGNLPPVSMPIVEGAMPTLNDNQVNTLKGRISNDTKGATDLVTVQVLSDDASPASVNSMSNQLYGEEFAQETSKLYSLANVVKTVSSIPSAIFKTDITTGEFLEPVLASSLAKEATQTANVLLSDGYTNATAEKRFEIRRDLASDLAKTPALRSTGRDAGKIAVDIINAQVAMIEDKVLPETEGAFGLADPEAKTKLEQERKQKIDEATLSLDEVVADGEIVEYDNQGGQKYMRRGEDFYLIKKDGTVSTTPAPLVVNQNLRNAANNPRVMSDTKIKILSDEDLIDIIETQKYKNSNISDEMYNKIVSEARSRLGQ